VSPSRLSSRGGGGHGAAPAPAFPGAGPKRAPSCSAPGPPPAVTLPVEWVKAGRIALPLARTEFSRSLRLRPPFHYVLISPMHPRADCSTGSRSSKSPLRLLGANCPELRSMPREWVPLAGIILNCYHQFTRHPTPAAQPVRCPPETKQIMSTLRTPPVTRT